MGSALEVVSFESIQPDRSKSEGDAWIGTMLNGTYYVVCKIASGGMGEVYEARHVRLGQRVAIKFIHPECADPGLLTRFRHEAEILAQLRHPHIVSVVDVDETEDRTPFLVMEYLVGETLAQRLTRSGRLNVPEIGRIALQIASALACTHARGIVHRDLKPENVMLLEATGESDFVKVLDFGISQHRRWLRRSDVLMGTPAYMAPEQATDPRSIDHRADQFALAAIIYEALGAQTPHIGSSMAEIVTSLTTNEPRPLTDVAPGVPDAIAKVVMRALQTDPEARFRDIQQFAWGLSEALARTEALTPSGSDFPAPREPRPTPGVQLRGTQATDLLSRARETFVQGPLDEAVRIAEELIELAAFEANPDVYAVIGRGMSALDRIFEARVGTPTARLTASALNPRNLSLSSKASSLLSMAHGQTVAQVLACCGFPRRDAMRMLAGLLRRGLLVAH